MVIQQKENIKHYLLMFNNTFNLLNSDCSKQTDQFIRNNYYLLLKENSIKFTMRIFQLIYLSQDKHDIVNS